MYPDPFIYFTDMNVRIGPIVERTYNLDVFPQGFILLKYWKVYEAREFSTCGSVHLRPTILKKYLGCALTIAVISF